MTSRGKMQTNRHLEALQSSTFSQGNHVVLLDVVRTQLTALSVSQTMNLIINLDNDEWILTDMDRTMEQYGACEWLLPRCFLLRNSRYTPSLEK